MTVRAHARPGVEERIRQGKDLLAGGRLRPAAASFLLAYRQARRAGDAVGMARALSGAGHAYCRLGDPDRAERMLRRGLRLPGLTPGQRGMLCLDLGLSRYQRGDDAGAARWWEEGERCFRLAGNARFRARCQSNLALLRAEGDPAWARSLLEEALAVLQREGDPEAYRTCTELARVYLDLGLAAAAGSMAARAWEGAVAARDAVELARVLSVLAELDAAAGRRGRAEAQWREALSVLGRHDPWEYKRCFERARRWGFHALPPAP